MSGLVEQLQMEALDKANSIADLLRKAKLAAVKLGMTDAVRWVDAELAGYKTEPPDYRMIKGELRWWNPYRGWQPAVIADAELNHDVCTRPVTEAVTSLEATIGSQSNGYMLLLPPDMVSALNDIFDAPFPITRMCVAVGRGSLVAVLEHVRGLVFDWALELEAAGILGADLGFSSKEKAIAMTSHISIGSMNGGNLNTGEISGTNARLVQGGDDRSSNDVVDRSVFGELQTAVSEQVADPESRDAIIAAARAMEEARDGAGKLGAYQRLINTAADHMTVITPFLPALSALLG